MKLISSSSKLEKELTRCINNYKDISIAVAWASAHTAVFSALIENKKKIKKAIIGTHFYQTGLPRLC